MEQTSQFAGSDDWVQMGRLPFSYAGVWQVLRKASSKAGLGRISSHIFSICTGNGWVPLVLRLRCTAASRR